MKKLLFLAFVALPLISISQDISSDEYIARRAKVLSMLDSTSILAMKSINFQPLANEYIQEHNFYYLTGIDYPSCTILFVPKGVKVGKQIKSILFFTTKNDELESIALGKSDTILKSIEFKAILNELLPSISKLYYSAPDLILVNDWLNDKAYFMEKEMKNGLKAKYPNLKLESAEYFVGKLREIKSPQEIAIIRKATNITSEGLISAMKIAKPGVYEYELQAAVEYEYTRQGAMLRGFPSIIGSGLNNLILHYDENTRKTENGDLVVMDVGAKYQGYSSDITRTIPISGKFSDAQKEIYQMVLNVQKEVIAMLKPGVSKRAIEKAARDGFKKVGFEKYLIHGISHPIGLDVHDISVLSELKPGMIITIEPGLYFPKNDADAPEKYRGFGIRIEDSILITDDGYEILSNKAPKEIAEIEKLMKKKK